MAVHDSIPGSDDSACASLFLPATCVPGDHARQTTGYGMAEHVLRDDLAVAATDRFTILDLGCGEGNSIDFFRRLAPAGKWIGVDIADSPEVRSRRRSDGDFRTFDGVHVPVDAQSVDLVFCNQVMTHVGEPVELLRDVRRVLKPGGGRFVGSTSHLEPMVSYSRTNFTPYGFAALLGAAGMELREIRPGIDGVTLILRRLFWKPAIFDRFYERESPLNAMIGVAGRMRGKSARQINARKLLFAGQYSFSAGVATSSRADGA
jgi:SAM-dependent methyltransferase